METNHQSKSIFYPPGGILIWIIIYLELITFGAGLIAFVYTGKNELVVFTESATHLNKTIATINTLLLLASGFYTAKGVLSFKKQEITSTLKSINWAMVFGSGFIVLKCVEYYGKMQLGYNMGYNTFFMFYWLLTGFHFIHVLVGLVILFFTKRAIIKQQNQYLLEDFEAGASFWHMCDLIWLMVFPVLYLLF